MFDNIEEFTKKESNIQDLYSKLVANVLEIDNIVAKIDQLEEDPEKNFEALEILYRNEFYLYMDHIGIYDDLLLNIERELKTIDNEFELARLRKEADKMLRVSVIEL